MENEEKNEIEILPTADIIMNKGSIISINSYATIYEWQERFFRKSSEGFSEVTKNGSRYFFKASIETNSISDAMIVSFLDLALNLVPELKGGTIWERFKSPGGIIEKDDKFFRVSYLQGIQEVREGFARWKTISTIYSPNSLKLFLKNQRNARKEI